MTENRSQTSDRSSLSGRCALVTGGAVRVGRAIALALAGEGMRVVVHYHSSSGAAEQVVAEIRAGGGEAVALQADLSGGGEAHRLADTAEDAFGGVDALINNASVFPEEALGEVDEALWERTMAVNLRAPFFLTQQLGARMRQRGGGAVVNLADIAGLEAWAGYAAHAVSKAGLVHLTRVAARALAPEVRVNAIAPATVLPPEGFPEARLRELERRIPLRHIGSPRDVTDAVIYLLRAPFVTGHTLVLDGGRTIV